jgi:hypothetical protein
VDEDQHPITRGLGSREGIEVVRKGRKKCVGIAVEGILLAAWCACVLACGASEEVNPERVVTSFSLGEFEDPPLPYRPWVRWWWPGGDVTGPELARELDLLVANYFGGAEIQPFDAGLDQAASPLELERRRSFDTEPYYHRLSSLLNAALERGFSLDITLGSGWPSGGMHVRPEESLKTLLWARRTVRGPGRMEIDLHEPDRPFFYLVASLAEEVFHERLARYEGARARLLAVIAAQVAGGDLSAGSGNVKDTVRLDPASVRILTARVGPDGILAWEAPEGAWEIVAFYEAPDGEYPLFNAQPEPGYVVDHLDREAVLRHTERLLGEGSVSRRYRGTVIRALFNDSLEFKTERLCSADIIGEFTKRRGYDPTPWLPAVAVQGADNTVFNTIALARRPEFLLSGEDFRIRYDYLHTVSDLFIERFIGAVRDWAAERSLLFRSQGYGIDIDILRAAGEADIPEAEQLYAGGSELFLKMISSAALLYGRPVVSAEAMVWMNRGYMTTPFKLKVSADKLFAAGINQIVFHGFPYSKNHQYGETGWHPFVSPFAGSSEYSSNISEADPFWRYMPRINRYIARCHYALRQGSPMADVLVYYPWFGFPTSFAGVSDNEELLFNGYLERIEPEDRLPELMRLAVSLGISETDPRVAWLVSVRQYLRRLESAGYSWAWVNDESLEQARSAGGRAVIGGSPCKAVLVLDTETMRPGAARNVARLAAGGVSVVLAGRIPRRQPGFMDYRHGDEAVLEAMDRLLMSSRARFLSGPEEVVDALEGLGIDPSARFLTEEPAIRYTARDLGNGQRIMFFQNQKAMPIETGIRVEGGCRDGQWVDVWGETGWRFTDIDEYADMPVSLPAYGSGMLLCGLPDAAGVFRMRPVPRQDPEGGEQPSDEVSLIDAWRLSVEGDDVAGGRVSLSLGSLPDWREIDQLRFSSSPGRYSGSWEARGVEQCERILLTVGWVHGAAEVYVNGRHAGSLLVPPFSVEITGLVREGPNDLEIVLTPQLRNRLIGKALQGQAEYREFSGKADTLLPGGIEGPVRIETRRKGRVPGDRSARSATSLPAKEGIVW